jgi:hypothetical protein
MLTTLLRIGSASPKPLKSNEIRFVVARRQSMHRANAIRPGGSTWWLHYIEWTPKTNIWCGGHRPGYRSYCHPGNYKGQHIKLYHNNHDGTFKDVSDVSGVGKPEAKGMGVVLADFNNDGWPDIAVADDSWPNFLFINNHDGTFEDISLVSGIAASEDERYEAGMGIDAADVDGDGWQDVYITHLDFELNRLSQQPRWNFYRWHISLRYRQQGDVAERSVPEFRGLRRRRLARYPAIRRRHAG